MTALLCTLTLAGCLAGPGQPRPLATGGATGPPSPVDGAHVDADEQAAVDAVLAVYRDFRQREDQLSMRPRPSEEIREALAPVLSSPLHTQMWAALAAIHDDGLVRRARPRSDVEVVQVELDGPPRRVLLRECLDITAAPLVHADSGELAGDELRGELWMAASTPGRYVRLIQADHYRTEGWLLREATWIREESC